METGLDNARSAEEGSDGVCKGVVSILLIGDERHQWEIEAILSVADRDISFIVHRADSLSEGLSLLNACHIDAILQVIAPQDNYDLSIVLDVKSQAPGVPVVVLGEAWDAEDAADALRAGAQDVLAQQDISAGLLKRSLLYAIERQDVLKELQAASLFDELTGLYNRRGFMDFARHYLKVAERSKRGIILFYADLDNLKRINDNFGHQAGDQAIVASAAMIKGVFRTSDIVARIGGDEFVALALDTDLSFTENILKRLKDKENDCSYPYPLSLSAGFAYCDPNNPCTIEKLLDQADKNMYASKREQKGRKEGTPPCMTYTHTFYQG